MNHLIRLARSGKPEHCEMWLNNNGKIEPCKNPIEFYCFESGGFLCSSCSNRMHKRFPKHIHIDLAKKYLKKLFP